jgi:hypothetical protein
MPPHRVADVGGDVFVVEFRAVDADHGERRIRERRLEFREVRKNVHAIDAAVGPKIEQHDVPFVDLPKG